MLKAMPSDKKVVGTVRSGAEAIVSRTEEADGSTPAFKHDMRFGISPEGAELLKGGVPLQDGGWVWTHARRVGDTALELREGLLVRLRLPATA